MYEPQNDRWVMQIGRVFSCLFTTRGHRIRYKSTIHKKLKWDTFPGRSCVPRNPMSRPVRLATDLFGPNGTWTVRHRKITVNSNKIKSFFESSAWRTTDAVLLLWEKFCFWISQEMGDEELKSSSVFELLYKVLFLSINNHWLSFGVVQFYLSAMTKSGVNRRFRVISTATAHITCELNDLFTWLG